MNEKCHIHVPEAIHILTFHLYCICWENLRPEHWQKLRSRIRDGEILSHFWELSQVFYMSGFVSWCSTFLVLWVLLESPRIRMFESVWKMRIFETNWLEVEEDGLGLGLSFVFLFAPSFYTYTPLAHCVIF